MYKHEQGIPMKIGNNRPLRGSVLAGVVGVLLLAGCQRESEPAPATDAAPPPRPALQVRRRPRRRRLTCAT